MIAALLRAASLFAHEDELVFPITAAHFRMRWWQALTDLGIQHCGPPHNLRHSGAAEFVAAGHPLSRAMEPRQQRPALHEGPLPGSSSCPPSQNVF